MADIESMAPVEEHPVEDIALAGTVLACDSDDMYVVGGHLREYSEGFFSDVGV